MTDSQAKRYQLLICDGPSCGVCHGSQELKEKAKSLVSEDKELAARLKIRDFTCFGRCGEGPNVLVRVLADGDPGDAEPDFADLDDSCGLYTEMDLGRIEKVVREHCGADQPIEDWIEPY